MSLFRKCNKEHDAQNVNSPGNAVRISCISAGMWKETIHHILIKHNYCNHQNCHHCMHEMYELYSIFFCEMGWSGRVVDPSMTDIPLAVSEVIS